MEPLKFSNFLPDDFYHDKLINVIETDVINPGVTDSRTTTPLNDGLFDSSPRNTLTPNPLVPQWYSLYVVNIGYDEKPHNVGSFFVDHHTAVGSPLESGQIWFVQWQVYSIQVHAKFGLTEEFCLYYSATVFGQQALRPLERQTSRNTFWRPPTDV